MNLPLTVKQAARLDEAVAAYNAHFQTTLTSKEFVMKAAMDMTMNWLVAVDLDNQRKLREQELAADLQS